MIRLWMVRLKVRKKNPKTQHFQRNVGPKTIIINEGSSCKTPKEKAENQWVTRVLGTPVSWVMNPTYNWNHSQTPFDTFPPTFFVSSAGFHDPILWICLFLFSSRRVFQEKNAQTWGIWRIHNATLKTWWRCMRTFKSQKRTTTHQGWWYDNPQPFFRVRSYNPYFQGLKPSCFMVLVSKGIYYQYCFERERRRVSKSTTTHTHTFVWDL